MIDDRILCIDCREYSAWNGGCLSAKEGRRHDVGERYGPAHPDELLRRCEFFLAKQQAEDQRSGRERFQSLWAVYEASQQDRQRINNGHAQRGLERAKAALGQ